MRSSILIGLVAVIGCLQLTSSTRTKRDVDIDIMGAMCAYGCLADHINHTAFRSLDGAGSMLCKHAEISQLEEICHVLKKGKECLIKDCASEKGPIIDMILEATTYGCETHWAEFQKYTPCFTSSCTYIENKCVGQCGTIAQAIKYTPEQKRRLDEIRKYSNSQHGQSDESNTDESEESSGSSNGIPGMDILSSFNLEGTCKYINCYLNCSEAPLTEKCGADTHKFLRQVVTDLSGMAFKGIFPNITTPPEQCQTLLVKSKEGSKMGSTTTQAAWTVVSPSIMILTAISMLIIFVTGRSE